ncbi:hypothetical protein SAMN05192573_10391 [Mucilaginibacter gossypii]|uniref:Uncharacterized protein n=1 Tax=Mucilaginibacter gossypii TaxID=551996 RepID=A0A1G7TAK3_9SPHI|nr:hypothetical protein SAMN05192573_10391 [Mucilaginibacter gossypii]
MKYILPDCRKVKIVKQAIPGRVSTDIPTSLV